MNKKLMVVAIVALFSAPLAIAHGDEKHKPTEMAAGRDVTGAQLAVAPAAADAVAVVERFSSAHSAGDLVAAGAELDPGVLILESGGVERSRDEYLGGHAKSDAAFLKTARMTLKRRSANASGDLVWVASESEIHATKDGAMTMIASTESMVLQKSDQGWKIVHIHWSSRRAGGSH